LSNYVVQSGWPRSLEIRENSENGQNKFPAGKIRELSGIFPKSEEKICLLVAFLHEIYQIDLFHQTDCKQYAF